MVYILKAVLSFLLMFWSQLAMHKIYLYLLCLCSKDDQRKSYTEAVKKGL